MTTWLQLSLDANETEAQLLEKLFENLGALSITLKDAGDHPLLEPPPESQPLWQRTRVTALFDGERNLEALRTELARLLDGELVARLRWERLEDRIWERVWLEHFKPMAFGRRLWVCPQGQSVKQADGIVIQLDPGLAFGTGTHPTTALCLCWLDALDLVGKSVIDYGCGSGILAIAALKLGAERAVAVDYDPQALKATRENGIKNGVDERLQTHTPDTLPTIQADILVANILAEPLMSLAPTLAHLLPTGGRFALSGILAEQQEAVAAHYQPFAELQPVRRQEEWILIPGMRS